MLRLQSEIEEEAYRIYRYSNPPMEVSRAGNMERDTFSFTRNKDGVVKIINGEEVYWGTDIKTTLDEILKKNKLVAGLLRSDIGYYDEKELFFISKEPKQLTEQFIKDWNKKKQLEKEEAERKERLKAFTETKNQLAGQLMGLMTKGVPMDQIINLQQEFFKIPDGDFSGISRIKNLASAAERHTARTETDVTKIREAWSNRKVNQLWDAINNGLLPSDCSSKIEEMKEDILFGDFDIFNKKAKVLDTAIKRHSQRTHSDIQDIQDRWDAKQKRDKQTKTVAVNVLKVAQGWSEVDYSTLEQMIADNNLTDMTSESKKVAQAINAMKAEEKALSDIIPNVHKWHDQFSLEELKKVKDAVLDKLDTWDWASDISIDKDPKAFKKKLDFEISWIESKKKYSTWEVAKAAYGNQLQKVEDKLWWDETKLKAEATILKLQTASPKLAKKFDKNLNDLIASGNKKSTDIMLYNLGKWEKIINLESSISSTGSAEAKKLHQYIKEGKLNKAWSEYQSLLKTTSINPFDPSVYSDARKAAAYIARSAYEADKVMLPDAMQAYSKATMAMKEAAESYTRASGSITKLARGIPGFHETDSWYADKSLMETLALTDMISLNRIKMDTWLYRDERSAFLTLKSSGLDVDKLDVFSRLLSQKLKTKNGGLWDTLTEHEYDSKMKQYARTLEKQLIGRTGIDPSFLSCGSHSNHHFSGTGGDNKNGFPKVRLEIYCPKGTQALYAAPFNHYNGKIKGPDGFWDGKTAPTSIHEAEVFLQRDSKFRIIDAKYDFDQDRWFVKVEVIAQDVRTIDGNEYVTGEGYKLKFK